MNYKHGQRHSRIYNIYYHMKNRCYNVKDNRYNQYGDRGIKVCDEWKNSFKSFYEWSMNNGYNDNLTIDRIDNNGNYEPLNCRWVDNFTQMQNRSNNHFITINGETKVLFEWCRIYGLNPTTINQRIKRGWKKEDWFKPLRR